ncbi:unnamed protein product [Nezara viridula]|uniref:N-acetyltransferase domain-containing protein n=1 Tax=Nezara viridula TaxID=85310 RepID=A0A9P0MVK5_NEZVI|nr:unnamed protein product [Nezara viridula]
MEEINIRKATKCDCTEIMRLVKELAEFENMPDQVNLDAESKSQVVKVFRGWECGTDHFMLRTKILFLWKVGRSLKAGRCKAESITLPKYKLYLLMEESAGMLYGSRLEEKIDLSRGSNLSEKYEHLRECIHSAAWVVLGDLDWIAYRALNKRVKDEVVKEKNNSWERCCQKIDGALGFNQMREVWSILKSLRTPRIGTVISYITLAKDGFETNNPPFHCLVIDEPENSGNSEDKAPKLIGYALYSFTYGTWEGKRMWLEDIMVTNKYRIKGIGKRLFSAVCQKALRENCKAVRFVVLKWNPAMKFYQQFGTTNLTEKEEWQFSTLQYEDVLKAANLFK